MMVMHVQAASMATVPASVKGPAIVYEASRPPGAYDQRPVVGLDFDRAKAFVLCASF